MCLGLRSIQFRDDFMNFNKPFLVIVSILILLTLYLWSPWTEKVDDAVKDQQPKSETQEKASPKKGRNAMASLEKSFGGKETPIPVLAEPAIFGDLVQKVVAQGKVYAYQKTDIVSEVSGRLVKNHVVDGQRIKKGDILAEIDDRSFELAYEDAQAKYVSALADFIVFEQSTAPDKNGGDSLQEKRDALDKKFADGEISRENYRQKSFLLDLESIKSGGRRTEVVSARTKEQARIQRDRAKLDWEKCKIKAPFDGQIFDVAVTEGQLISANTKLFHLMNMSELVVKARVLESEIGQIQEGREAEIEFPALLDLGRMKAKVTAVSPYVNSDDKTIETILKLKKGNPRIRPGMFAEVHLDAAVYHDSLMVPKTAILPRDDRKVIFVVGPDKRASWLYVETGAENEDYVAITKGKLKEGDMVLTDNHFTMGHGTLVKIVKKK